MGLAECSEAGNKASLKVLRTQELYVHTVMKWCCNRSRLLSQIHGGLEHCSKAGVVTPWTTSPALVALRGVKLEVEGYKPEQLFGAFHSHGLGSLEAQLQAGRSATPSREGCQVSMFYPHELWGSNAVLWGREEGIHTSLTMKKIPPSLLPPLPSSQPG